MRIVVGLRLRQPAASGLLEHRIEPIRAGLIRSPEAKIPLRGAALEDIAQQGAENARRLGLPGSRGCDRDCVVARFRQVQIAQQQAAVGVRVGAHPQRSGRAQRLQDRSRRA